MPYLILIKYQLTTKKLSFKLESYSDRAKCFGRLGR